MLARILFALLLASSALAQEKGGDNPEAPYLDDPPQAPRGPAEMCLVDGCNGVQVLNEAPIPVVVQTRRVPFLVEVSVANSGDGLGLGCADVTPGEGPIRIEYASATVSNSTDYQLGRPGAEPIEGGYLMVGPHAAPGHAFIYHYAPLQSAGRRGFVGSAPLAIESATPTFRVCIQADRFSTARIVLSGTAEAP